VSENEIRVFKKLKLDFNKKGSLNKTRCIIICTEKCKYLINIVVFFINDKLSPVKKLLV